MSSPQQQSSRISFKSPDITLRHKESNSTLFVLQPEQTLPLKRQAKSLVEEPELNQIRSDAQPGDNKISEPEAINSIGNLTGVNSTKQPLRHKLLPKLNSPQNHLSRKAAMKRQGSMNHSRGEHRLKKADSQALERIATSIDSTTRKLMSQKTSRMGESSSSRSSSSSSFSDSSSLSISDPKDRSIRRRGNISSQVTVNMKHKRRSSSTKSTTVLLLWSLFVGLLCLLSSIEYGLASAFLPSWTARESQGFHARSNFYELIMFVDLGIGFLNSLKAKVFGTLDRPCIKAAVAIEILMKEHTLDIVALVPFSTLISSGEQSYFYLIKLVRLTKGFSILDYKGIITFLKERQIKRIQRQTAEEKFVKVSDIVLLATLLKTFRFVAIIVTVSFFTGILWFIICEVSELRDTEELEHFGQVYQLSEQPTGHVALLLTYFSFTTLSTVGLGDLHPKNDAERIVCSFVMLFGVMTTSFLIENFSSLLNQLRTFNLPYSDYDNLTLFIGTIRKFNSGHPQPENEVAITKYFKYRWKRNRNLAVSTQVDNELLDQLPKKLILSLYVDYLFRDFMDNFKGLFAVKEKISIRRMLTYRKSQFDNIPKIFIPQDASVGCSDSYEEFLVKFLRRLEPISLQEGEEIQRIEERVNQVYFLTGTDIEVNFNFRKLLYHLSKSTLPSDSRRKSVVFENMGQMLELPQHSHSHTVSGCMPVGLFENMFDLNSQFRYRIKRVYSKSSKRTETNTLSCFFIRHLQWKKVQTQFFHGKAHEQFKDFETKVIQQYLTKIYLPIKGHQTALEQPGEPGLQRAKTTKALLSIFKKSSTTTHPEEAPLPNLKSKEELLELIHSYKLAANHNPKKLISLIQLGSRACFESQQTVCQAKGVLDSNSEALDEILLSFLDRAVAASSCLFDQAEQISQLERQLQAERERANQLESTLENVQAEMSVKISEQDRLLEQEKKAKEALVKLRGNLLEENAKLTLANRKLTNSFKEVKRKLTVKKPSEQPRQGIQRRSFGGSAFANYSIKQQIAQAQEAQDKDSIAEEEDASPIARPVLSCRESKIIKPVLMSRPFNVTDNAYLAVLKAQAEEKRRASVGLPEKQPQEEPAKPQSRRTSMGEMKKELTRPPLGEKRTETSNKLSLEGDSHITEELSHYDRMESLIHPDYGEYSDLKKTEDMIPEEIKVEEEQRMGRRMSVFSTHEFCLDSASSASDPDYAKGTTIISTTLDLK